MNKKLIENGFSLLYELIKTTIAAYLCWVIESDDVANLDYYMRKKNPGGEEREQRKGEWN